LPSQDFGRCLNLAVPKFFSESFSCTVLCRGDQPSSQGTVRPLRQNRRTDQPVHQPTQYDTRLRLLHSSSTVSCFRRQVLILLFLVLRRPGQSPVCSVLRGSSSPVRTGVRRRNWLIQYGFFPSTYCFSSVYSSRCSSMSRVLNHLRQAQGRPLTRFRRTQTARNQFIPQHQKNRS